MASNHLFSINTGDFPVMPNLNYLFVSALRNLLEMFILLTVNTLYRSLLKRNRISEVASDSIGNLTKLKIL